MDELISIIITVYNLQDYISECLESVINQTYKNLQIIIIDDGSTDKSLSICKKYAEIDSRIEIYSIDNTGMAAKARNVGLDLAKGEYIGFVDGDDFIELDMYEKLINACKLYKTDISCCGITRYISKINKYNIKTIDKTCKLQAIEAKKEILSDGIIGLSVWSKLFKRDVISNIRFPEQKYNEDLVFVWNAIGDSNQVVHIGNAKYYYRIREESVTQTLKYDSNIKWIVENAINMFNQSSEELKDYLGIYITKVNSVCLINLQKSRSIQLYKDDYHFYRKNLKKYGNYYLSNKSARKLDKLRVILAYLNFYSIKLSKKRNIQYETK